MEGVRKVQVGCEGREGQVRESGELASTPPLDICSKARTVCFLPSFYPGLGTSEPTGVGDCGFRKSEVCQQMVVRRRPSLSWACPPGLTPSALFLPGPSLTAVPGFAMLRAGVLLTVYQSVAGCTNVSLICFSLLLLPTMAVLIWRL